MESSSLENVLTQKKIVASLITRMMLLFVLLGLVPDAQVDAPKDITTLTRMSEVTSKRTTYTKEIQQIKT